MQRPLCLLALTLLALPGDVLADPLRTVQNYQIRRETQAAGNDSLWQPYVPSDDEPGGLVGRWRKTEEALEPKWRDGDSVPSLPFPRFSESYPKYIIEDEDEEESPRQKMDYNPQQTRTRHFDETPGYGLPSRKDTREERVSFSQSRSRPIVVSSVLPKEASRNERRNEEMRYREAFQARPSGYEHEFNDEEYLRPRPRKRRPPQNYEFVLAANEATLRAEKDRSRAIDRKSGSPDAKRNDQRQSSEKALELKTLLKMQQEEGLSLSEILQRRNLTLNDLLKGKADVISVLKSKDDETDEYMEEASKAVSNSLMKLSVTSRPSWTTQAARSNRSEEKLATSSLSDNTIPISATESTTVSEKKSSATDKTLDSAETVHVTPDPSWTKAETPTNVLTTVTTTNTPIPITNSMELYQNEDGNVRSDNSERTRTEDFDEDEIMEFSDFTDFKKGKNIGSPIWITRMKEEKSTARSQADKLKDKDTVSTLSIENILRPTERIAPVNSSSKTVFHSSDESANKTLGEVKNQPPFAFDNPKEDYGFLEPEYQDDAPMDTEDVEQSTIDNIKDKIEAITGTMKGAHPKPQEVSSTVKSQEQNGLPENRHSSSRRYEDIISEIEPEARAEIFELYASSSAGKRLERLLKSRNMSLEELIALRQRGSSKVHLAEVSRLKEQKLAQSTDRTDPTSNAIGDVDAIANATTEAPSRQESGAETNVTKMPYHRDNVLERGNRSDTDHNFEGKEKHAERTAQIADLLTTFASLPFAKDIQRDFMLELNNPAQRGSPSILFARKEETRTTDPPDDVQTGYVEEIVNNNPNSIDIQMYSESSSTESDEERKALSKVKPSIIASGAILGVTIVVFLAILIVCRIRQKQKYTYRSTFSKSVFQGPVMTARKLSNSSSLSTVMVNVVATSTTKRPERNENANREGADEFDPKSDIDNDSLDANDSWETIPDYMK